MSNLDATTLDVENQSRLGPVERLLSVFGDVRAGEAATVLLLLGNIFLILAGYYVCKTVREPLILASGGAEVKSYAAAGQALVLMLFVPLYGWFASKVNRSRLIYGVTLFFIINIELFWLGAKLGVPYLGVAFFIWVGIFNNAVIAQFWSYGNDLFSTETGERLFPLIGIGATLGSPFGSGLAERLFTMGVGAYTMLHITAVILLISMGLYWLVEKRLGSPRQQGQQGGSTAKLKGHEGGFKLLAGNRYLRLICVLLILLNLVNTTGQYVLDRYVLAEAVSRAATDAAFNKEAFLGAFYGGYMFWVNILTFVLQALLVSRIVKYLGLAGALLALPIVALGSYSTVLAGATLVVLRVAKTVENATDYSIMNTARQMLWLPTSREEKYKAKQAADTFIVRVGDLMSAGLVYVGTTVLGFHSAGFATVNIIACVLWLGVGVMLLRQYRKLAAQQAAPAAAGSS
jgi:AAA family ATP:ADP antiporter